MATIPAQNKTKLCTYTSETTKQFQCGRDEQLYIPYGRNTNRRKEEQADRETEKHRETDRMVVIKTDTRKRAGWRKRDGGSGAA